MIAMPADRWRAGHPPVQVPHRHHTAGEEERLSAAGTLAHRMEVAVSQPEPTAVAHR